MKVRGRPQRSETPCVVITLSLPEAVIEAIEAHADKWSETEGRRISRSEAAARLLEKALQW